MSAYGVKPMSDEEWFDADAQTMAQHISLGEPQTDFAKIAKVERNTTDKLTNFWLDRIDSMDPTVSQDLTSEFMNVQKTEKEIKKLEAKIAAEEHDWNAIDQYNTDKMLLANYK